MTTAAAAAAPVATAALLTRSDLDEDCLETLLAIRRPVGIGLKVLDVNRVSDVDQTMRCKYSIEVAWTDEQTEYTGADRVGWKPHEQGPLWGWRVGPRLLVVNTLEGSDDGTVLTMDRTPSTTDLDSASSHKKDRGLHRRLVHRAGELLVTLNFRWFPFDTQILPIELRALGSRYNASKGSFPIKPMGFLLAKTAKQLAEWNLSCHSVVYHEELGDTFGIFATLTFNLQGDCNYTSNFANLFLLPFFVTATTFSCSAIAPEAVGERIAVVLTMLLTHVAFT
jgi:hypothetical protein